MTATANPDPIRIPFDRHFGEYIEITPDIARQIVALAGAAQPQDSIDLRTCQPDDVLVIDDNGEQRRARFGDGTIRKGNWEGHRPAPRDWAWQEPDSYRLDFHANGHAYGVDDKVIAIERAAQPQGDEAADRWTQHTPCCNGGLHEPCDCPVSMTHKELAGYLIAEVGRRADTARELIAARAEADALAGHLSTVLLYAGTTASGTGEAHKAYNESRAALAKRGGE